MSLNDLKQIYEHLIQLSARKDKKYPCNSCNINRKICSSLSNIKSYKKYVDTIKCQLKQKSATLANNNHQYQSLPQHKQNPIKISTNKKLHKKKKTSQFILPQCIFQDPKQKINKSISPSNKKIKSNKITKCLENKNNYYSCTKKQKQNRSTSRQSSSFAKIFPSINSKITIIHRELHHRDISRKRTINNSLSSIEQAKVKVNFKEGKIKGKALEDEETGRNDTLFPTQCEHMESYWKTLKRIKLQKKEQKEKKKKEKLIHQQKHFKKKSLGTIQQFDPLTQFKQQNPQTSGFSPWESKTQISAQNWH